MNRKKLPTTTSEFRDHRREKREAFEKRAMELAKEKGVKIGKQKRNL